jgi:hypothetical protein
MLMARLCMVHALVGPYSTNKAERKARVNIVRTKVKAAMAFVMPAGGKKSATEAAEVLLCNAAIKAAVDAAAPPTSEKAVLAAASANSGSKVAHQSSPAGRHWYRAFACCASPCVVV